MAKRPRNPERRANVILGAAIAAVVVVGVVLVLLNTVQQQRLATVRQTQVTGQRTAAGQRTDQTQLTCALWALLQGSGSSRVGDDVRQAADRICAGVPTPAASR
ncbi:hypothetical protein ACIQRE_01515 [Streptomyces griseoluteus]|uniref:hypothetical protein n=1 Tax=Streptomyces griseoluteus TaxID=29306 RepID=UPI0037F68DD2